MEPLSGVMSILAITNASLGIARSMVHTIQELYELAEAYETAALGIRTVATQLNSFRIAVQRLSKWLETQNEETKHDLDDDFWNALQENLQTATMMMDDLDKRIAGFKKTPTKFWTRTKFLWNGGVIAELQTQISGLMSARARIRARQEQHLLDEPVPDGDLPIQPIRLDQPAQVGSDHPSQANSADTPRQGGAEVNPTTQPSFGHPAIPDTAPPLYETLDGADATSTNKKEKKNRKKSSGDDKSKRGFWKNYRMTKATSGSTSSFSSLFSGAKSPPPEEKSAPATPGEPLSRTTSETANTLSPSQSQTATGYSEVGGSRMSQTPAPIDTNTDKEYFQLSAAMSGMDLMHSDLSAVEKNPMTSELPASVPLAELQADSMSERQSSIPTISQDPEAPPPLPPRPSAQARTEAQQSQGKSITEMPASTTMPARRTKSAAYLNEIVPASQDFERLRPSQRVRDASSKDRFGNRTPEPTDSVSTGISSLTSANSRSSSRPDSNISRLTSLSSFSSSTLGSGSGGGGDNSQKWITCPMPSRTVSFAVIFEDESFTNKMSASAARVLGVAENIVEYAGIPTTRLTMMHAVHTFNDGDGEADGDDGFVITGGEVEFVVMDEHERRTATLVLGAGMTHLKRLMREGEYVYWDSGPVPEKLRTRERLRLYRRFELVRW